MGFTPTSGPTPDFLAKYGPPTKERGKLKKMFRIGKGKNAVVDVAPRKGVLVEPGTEVDVDDDKIAEEWTVIDKNQKKEAPEVVLERSQTVAEVSTSKMPLPGEEEDEDEVEPDPQWQYRDVTYPNSNQQRCVPVVRRVTVLTPSRFKDLLNIRGTQPSLLSHHNILSTLIPRFVTTLRQVLALPV